MSILSVLGGIYAFGFLGMVLGPLVVAIAIGMLQGYRKDLKPEPAE
jgi:predicted PurR-regulated permease PerM